MCLLTHGQGNWVDGEGLAIETWRTSQTCISLVFIWFKFWVQLMLGRLQDDCNCFLLLNFCKTGFSVNCIQICGSTCAGLVQSAFIRAWLSCNFSDGALSFLESLIWFAGKILSQQPFNATAPTISCDIFVAVLQLEYKHIKTISKLFDVVRCVELVYTQVTALCVTHRCAKIRQQV